MSSMYIIGKYVQLLRVFRDSLLSPSKADLDCSYLDRWFDIGIGLASGVFAFHTYQMKYIPEDRRLQTLLKRGYNVDKQKERLAAEAELENEATAELAKLFEGEQGNSKNSTAARV